jgi:signal transduction histidine kinase
VSLFNGDRLLADTGLFPQALLPIVNGRIPVLFALPTGTERVDITLQTLPYIGAGLTHIQLGATNLLMPIANEGLAHIVGYANAAAGVLLVLALMLLFLWLSRRQDLGLLWMCVACTLWSVRALAYYDSSVDMPALWFEQLNPLNIMLTAAALAAATVWTWAGHLNPRVWRALVGMSALSAIALTATTALGQGALAARTLTQLMAFFTVVWTMAWVWQRTEHIALRHWRALLLGYSAMMACAVHDIMLVTGPIAPTGPSYLFWGFSVLLVMFAIITGEYIVNALSVAEHSNDELARRIDEKTLALSHSYGQLRDTEVAVARDAARTQERERLLRDMHDGMGAQLMTALRGVERGTLSSTQLAQSLQDGLDELRLLMDSTDNTQALQSALANWRNRWDTRLDATGLTLQWQIDDALEGLKLPGDTVLQVMRVLQEAATNIVKHAHATHASVSATVIANAQGVRELVLEIADNGIGLNREDWREGNSRVRGHGIDNMHHRAQQIGATLRLANAADGLPGAVVRLSLPLLD